MARTRNLLQLRTDIRNRGDLLSSRHPDAELTRNINQSISELYRLLVSCNPDYYIDSDDITIVSGTADYALDSAYYKTVGMDLLDGSIYYPMERFNFSERNRNQGNTTVKYSTMYRVMGSNVKFIPTPTWAGTVRHWFIPLLTDLTEDADTFDGIAGWEEYIVLDCLIKAKIKDECDITETAALKGALIKEIKDNAATRDKGEPNRVRDVYDELSGIILPFEY